MCVSRSEGPVKSLTLQAHSPWKLKPTVNLYCSLYKTAVASHCLGTGGWGLLCWGQGTSLLSLVSALLRVMFAEIELGLTPLTLPSVWVRYCGDRAREGERNLLWKGRTQELEKSRVPRKRHGLRAMPGPWFHPLAHSLYIIWPRVRKISPSPPSLPPPESPHSPEPGWFPQGLLGMTSPSPWQWFQCGPAAGSGRLGEAGWWRRGRTEHWGTWGGGTGWSQREIAVIHAHGASPVTSSCVRNVWRCQTEF